MDQEGSLRGDVHATGEIHLIVSIRGVLYPFVSVGSPVSVVFRARLSQWYCGRDCLIGLPAERSEGSPSG